MLLLSGFGLIQGRFRADPCKNYMAVSNNQGPFFGSPKNKDHRMLRSILGPPMYAKLHLEAPGTSCRISALRPPGNRKSSHCVTRAK